MTFNIFCPSSHLIFGGPRCPVCGWERPAAAKSGQIAWGPFALGSGLGGPGRHVFANPAAVNDKVAFPLNNGEIVGWGLRDGKKPWRTLLEAGLVTRHLVDDGHQMFATLSDERPIGQAGTGKLISLDPATGKLETLWQADTHQISPPAITDKQILLRTSTSELIAFRRTTKLDIQWKVTLETWWALAPHIADGKVFVCDGNAMRGEGRLVAYYLETGEQTWAIPTDGMLTQPFASGGNCMIIQNGHKEIVGLDVRNGKSIWQIKANRLYTAPVMGNKHMYVVMRGTSTKGEDGYYIIKAMDPASGNTNWEASVPCRVLVPPIWFENRVYLATEDGRILGYGDQSSKLELDIAIGNEEDPLRANLVVADGILLAATYSGNVFGVQVAAQQEELETPEVYLRRGNFEAAATAFAQTGDLRAAARLYSEQLHDGRKALMILDHGHFYNEAAKLARSQDLLAEAEDFYKKAGDLENQAQMLLMRGDKLGAARLFEQIKKFDMAARLFEEASEYGRAIELYRKLGDKAAVIRVSKAAPADLASVEWLLEQGNVSEAAEAAIRAGAVRRAVEIFNQVGEVQSELDALLLLVENDPERWSLERIADLARKTARFVDEAEAWEKLKKPRQTADAYQRAGKQAEMRTPDDPMRIAQLYERAAHYYDSSGMEEEEKVCRDSVSRYRELPVVRIIGHMTKEFKEYEWNTVELEITNVGYGVASELSWAVDEKDFDTRTNETWHLSHLADGRQKRVEVHIRPHQGQVGERVPFYLEWSWKAGDGTRYEDHISTSVLVKSKDDTHPAAGTPVIIGAGGKLIQTQHYVEGDEVESGGQKGDKVEIHRGGGVSVSAGEDHVHLEPKDMVDSSTCPNCSLPVDPESKYCNACGYELPKQVTKRKRAKGRMDESE